MKTAPKKKPLAANPASVKLTIRISEADLQKLTELRIAMHCRSDAQAVRALIISAYAHASKSALRAARAAVVDDPRQLGLYGGTK